MKYLLFILPILFIGCSETVVQKVYVDANGTEVYVKPEYRTIDPEIVCDKRGYAYYAIGTGGRFGSIASGSGETYTPMLENESNIGTRNIYQLECKDL